MNSTPSEQRLAENEAIFRKLNEQVIAGVEQTNRLAREDNQPEFSVTSKSDDAPLQFFCECADENCTGRVSMNLLEYRKIHKNRKRFVILPGHEVTSVEKVVFEKPTYTVVEKGETPPENPKTLNPTSVRKA